ncbi:MAG TPA: hypothetical protein PLR83_01275 [Pyrinomonadaceae bacterium]|nr:hypothetical protein [Pyrinomonadaceae bacterium]
MARKFASLQGYPRRSDDYLAEDSLFPLPKDPISAAMLEESIREAFDRSLKVKSGESAQLPQTPEELVKLCIKHLRERSDPVLSPSFYSQCRVEEIFELDAISHEMQRQRMRIGVFYQYLVIELMRRWFSNVYDGKREGDVEADIDTPEFPKGLRIFMSVKKSADTVGGQDVAGMFRRLESLAIEDKNLTRPYMGVVCIATPPRGKILPFEVSRSVKRNADGHPYSPNCEVWSPGFIFPYISGLHPNEIYKMALAKVGEYLPFYALAQRETCSTLLAEELSALDLVNEATGMLDPIKFQEFITQPTLKRSSK